MPKVYFIEDRYNKSHRVWMEGNAGDVFHMMKTPTGCSTREIGEMLEKLCEYYPTVFVYGDPEEE